MRWFHLACAAGFALPLLGYAGKGSAYCRAKTCELGRPPDGSACPASVEGCRRDERCCPIDGADLAWADPCLQFAVQADGSPRHGIDAEALADAALDAFERWQQVECPGGGSPRFQAQLSGFVQCSEPQTVCRGPSDNVSAIIAVESGWTHSSSQLGLTTPVAVVGTGEIVDADVELNLATGPYSAMPGTAGYDELAYVLTHEIGHFFGIGHSNDPSALMFYAYQSRRQAASLLAADDVAAICAVFPPSSDPPRCAPNSGPAYNECAVPVGDGSAAEAMGMSEAACIDIGDLAPAEASRGCSPHAVTKARAGWPTGLALLSVSLAWRGSRRRRGASSQRGSAPP